MNQFWKLAGLLKWGLGKRPRPIRIEQFNGTGLRPRLLRFENRARIGPGAECDIRLGGASATWAEAPATLLELVRGEGPVLLCNPLEPGDLAAYLEVYVNGEPFAGKMRPLSPGTRLELINKATRQRHELLISPRPRLPVRPRTALALVAAMMLAAGTWGAWLVWDLHRTKLRLVEAETRLEEAEHLRKASEANILKALTRMEISGSHMAKALREFETQQALVERAMRAEFHMRLEDIRQQAGSELAALTQQDEEKRRRLEQETRLRIDTLHSEFSQRMVETYQLFKEREEGLLASLAAQGGAHRQERVVFQDVFQRSRGAILFIRTDYRVHFVQTNEERNITVFGTGFFIAPNGLGMTARHTLYPWLYDRQFLVLSQLGYARFIPGSVRVSMWMVDRRVVRPGSGEFDHGEAYRTDGTHEEILMLHASDPTPQEVMMESPLGPVMIEVPGAEEPDVAVFQIMDFQRRFPSIPLEPLVGPPGALDEVLVVGYPLSRLQDGKSVPQASRGIVRRTTARLLELESSLLPGVSGGPILNREGRLVGMAYGIISSPTYGLAMRAGGMLQHLRMTRDAVGERQRRMAGLGCDPGPPDGHIGPRTWRAYLCAKNLLREEEEGKTAPH